MTRKQRNMIIVIACLVLFPLVMGATCDNSDKELNLWGNQQERVDAIGDAIGDVVQSTGDSVDCVSNSSGGLFNRAVECSKGE
jgi:hypothetical protein